MIKKNANKSMNIQTKPLNAVSSGEKQPSDGRSFSGYSYSTEQANTLIDPRSRTLNKDLKIIESRYDSKTPMQRINLMNKIESDDT